MSGPSWFGCLAAVGWNFGGRAEGRKGEEVNEGRGAEKKEVSRLCAVTASAFFDVVN